MKLLIVTALAASLAVPAFAQESPCGSRAEMLDKVTQAHGETLRFRALTKDGNMLEIFVHPTSGEFSLFLTFPSGQTCVPVWGGGASFFEPAALGEPS